ncbi:SGNH/GDSL hydrolase family protein [Streptomyces sp. CA-210063]|uniref:SGNH/GDSL hydrolase family protein n=1 Tax=Streptomyces sp. CA-210063 TaxID=2801029 RepID=UPI00214B6A7A|nr:SGNH/GDSL hydrolase family protein [Streptomyces sp. CA-210063]UUU29051.1 SGNH/GDSL hydrolase family protein [Streptomyces sp. CA-210063]
MRTSLRAGLAGALACGVLVTAMTLGRDGDGDGGGGDGSAPPTGPYVALGDSYTAGPRIPDQSGVPAGCERSGRNYPAVVAAELKIKASDFRDVSCTGATIADLSAPQSTDDGTNPAQFDALSEATRLVTVGIGGNDIGFASVIRRCVTSGVLYAVAGGRDGDAPCKERYVSDDVDEVRQRIEAADGRLARALDEVGRRAPKARVYVVGYPAILPSDGGDCGRELSLAPGDVSFVRAKERELNTMLRQRAEAAGARYVDTYGPSEGHDACSAEDTRWIEPLLPRSPAASVHPNERGERGMADAVLHALGARP